MVIDSIKKGIVIDHIKAGRAMEVYNYLELDKLDCCVAIIKRAKSNLMGTKDIIKIEGNVDVDLEALGFIDPHITVNIIENDKIVEKKRMLLPETLVNVVKCKNPRCITSVEQEIEHIFKLTDKEKGLYRCIYCEKSYKPNK